MSVLGLSVRVDKKRSTHLYYDVNAVRLAKICKRHKISFEKAIEYLENRPGVHTLIFKKSEMNKDWKTK